MSTLVTPHQLDQGQDTNVKLMISVYGCWKYVMGMHYVQISLMLNYATLTSGVLEVKIRESLPSIISAAPLLANIQNVDIIILTTMESMIVYPEEMKISSYPGLAAMLTTKL